MSLLTFPPKLKKITNYFRAQKESYTMPFTPIHFGFSIFIFGILPFMDPIALLVGAVIIDLEPIFYLITGIGQMHGIMHSTLGVLVFIIPTTLISWLFHRFLKFEKYLPRYNVYLSVLSGILGLYSHVVFDGILYSEIMFLYPFSNQAGMLYNLIPHNAVYWILGILFLIGLVLITLKYFIIRKKTQVNKEEDSFST